MLAILLSQGLLVSVPVWRIFNGCVKKVPLSLHAYLYVQLGY
jgi:hypothetical protein